jgi:hypothetical protein
MPHRVRDTRSSHANSRASSRDKAVDAAFVSSPGEGRGRFAMVHAVFISRLYAVTAVRLDFLCRHSHLPIMLRRLPRAKPRRAAMSVLFSGVDETGFPLDEEAYRAWLISRQQSPIVHRSGAMHLKRLRVLARKINNHVRAALTTMHEAIVAAKMRRIRRELMFNIRELRDFPQRPLILDDKWDF